MADLLGDGFDFPYEPMKASDWQETMRENEIAELAYELYIRLVPKRYGDSQIPINALSYGDYPTLADEVFMLADQFINVKHARESRAK